MSVTALYTSTPTGAAGGSPVRQLEPRGAEARSATATQTGESSAPELVRDPEPAPEPTTPAPVAPVSTSASTDAATAAAERVDPRLAHLLRLSLDLQLDAMLFTLGAVATHDDDADPMSSGPWRRWVTEDLDLSRCLAGTAAGLGLALPPTLGRTGRHQDSRKVTDDLIARYEFMTNLLEDLLDRSAGQESGPLLDPVVDALARIRSRLVELRAWAQPVD